MRTLRTDPEGSRLLRASLARTARRCDRCGFEDTVLDGAWRVRTAFDARSGHVVYELECPDCASTTEVALSLS